MSIKLEGAVAITDQDSNVISNSDIIYNIDVKNGCYFDDVALTNTGTYAHTFTIGNNSPTVFTTLWTQTIATCPVLTTLVIRNSDSTTTAISSSDITFVSGDGTAPTAYTFTDSTITYISPDVTLDG